MQPEVLDYELLSQARAWLSDRKHWIKGDLFRGRKYNSTGNVGDVTATCAVGALMKAAGMEGAGDPRKLHAYQLLASEVIPHYNSIEDFNDSPRTTHKGILGLFDRAMAKAKALATR